MSDQNDQPVNLREALQSAGRKLAEALNDLQALEVKTKAVDVRAGVLDEESARIVAFTRIQLDGDMDVIVPTQDEGGAIAPDPALLALHKESVAEAKEYRAQLINMVVDFFRQGRAR